MLQTPVKDSKKLNASLAEDTNAKPKHLVMDNPRLALRSEIF
jgi:hypothetical protein